MRQSLLSLLLALAVSWWTPRARAQANEATEAAAPTPSTTTPSTTTAPATPPQRVVVFDRNSKLRVALLATGIPLFVLSYALPCAGARGVWCAPVVGPILKIKQIADKQAQVDPDEDGIVPPVFIYTLLVELAAVQLASASLIMAGALLPRREGRRVVQTVDLLPSLSPTAVGLSAVGTF